MRYTTIAARNAAVLLASASAVTLAAAAEAKAGGNPVPSFITSKILSTHYDGASDDLLTAGLGKSGLAAATAPSVSSPPTAAELRRLAIYNNYRALVDPTAGGGFGTLYGPNVTADGTPTNGEGKIAGTEELAFAKDSTGESNVTVMVQVPDSFDPSNACIVTAPSSGSRGVYGAIATAGEWGLKHGCAVAYTDKGTGTGAHDLQNNTVNLIQGQRADAATAGGDSNFTADLVANASPKAAADALTSFNAATPNRFAFKQAHSQRNPEKAWGEHVLQSIQFAFYVVNELKGSGAGKPEITKQNTIVIASSVSNGGGASVRAAEQDKDGLIDGVAVGEPNVNPVYDGRFSIVQAGRPPLTAHSRTLIDYTTLYNVFQGCANAAPDNATAGLNLVPGAGRCAALHDAGLLTAATTAEQGTEAQKIINDFGILPEQNLVEPGYWFGYVSQSISMTYANAYGRFSVADNLCNYSFAGTASGVPAPLAPTAEASIFGTSNGIPPTSGVSLINNAAPGGAKEDRASTPDQDLAGALCLRSLATGKDAVSGAQLTGQDQVKSRRIADGVKQILASGKLHGVPTIFVTGRNDGILPPNFASRAYFGLNNLLEGQKSNLHYYEVTNAHHLDSFNQFPGYDSRYIPLHRYFLQAMDLMWSHLKNGTALPPSQVVHTTPRGAGAPPITLDNVPPILDAPAAGNLITFTSNEVLIPD
ncbi:MAG TPA: 3-hydroxybutyrate oligomer hydrolase family protein [Stellaceae bacterium]|jgi:hydroxybutyrate-dimer hydrolase